MIPCITGAPSGKYIFTGNARTVYEDSGLTALPPGSVLGGREVLEGDDEGPGMGSGRTFDAIRIYRS